MSNPTIILICPKCEDRVSAHRAVRSGRPCFIPERDCVCTIVGFGDEEPEFKDEEAE